MIRVGFSTSSWWVSRVICWFTRAKTSHAFLLLDGEHAHPIFGDLVLEAEWWGFALSTKATLLRGTTRIVALAEPKVPLDDAVRTAGSWLDERYDYGGLFGEAWVSFWRWFGKKVRNPVHDARSMFCSEAVVYVLQAAKYPGADQLDPGSTSPQDLAEFFGIDPGKG
jgi:hypothetical protein